MIHKQNSNKKKKIVNISLIWQNSAYFYLRIRVRTNTFTRPLIQPTIQYRRSSLTFSNLTHSSFLIKSKSITLRIVTYNKTWERINIREI